MAYSDCDLALFAILRRTSDLDGTAYFELHPGEVPEPFACWLEGSIFIRDAGFDFVADCFARANSKFDYFAFERFDAAQLETLSGELGSFLQVLEPGCQRDTVFARYESLFSREVWKDVATDPLREAVSRATVSILEFVQQTRAAQKPLWVMGM
jgi:hypothetical protein